jgi:hypothetical protein
MKPNRDAAALAESLRSAAAAPLPLPAQPLEMEPVTSTEPSELKAEDLSKSDGAGQRRRMKAKDAADTVQIALRPTRELLNRYVLSAADRTRKEGKVISAQQIMLEVLEKGPKVHA